MNRLLCAALLLGTATSAQAQPLLSLIDAGGGVKLTAKGMPDPYRSLPFIELRDTAGREREYSVPFVGDLQVRTIAADFKNNWEKYQDTMYWNRQAAMNSGLLSTALGHRNGTFCSWMPNPSAPAEPKPKEIGLQPSADPTAGEGSQLNFIPNWTSPVVPTSDACQNVSGTFFPDETHIAGVPTIVGTVYTPAVRHVGPFGGYLDMGGNPWPIPSHFDWEQVMARTEAACKVTSQQASLTYQTESQKSLRVNAPLAIDWDGTLAWKDVKSGTTMTPFFLADPDRLQQYAESEKQLISAAPDFYAYLKGATPSAVAVAEHAKDLQNKEANPGLSKYEVQKLSLFPGPLNVQEQRGYASIFQAWQKLDTVVEQRPSTYSAVAYIFYWSIWGTFTPVPVPVMLTAPHQIVTPLGCTHVPSGYAIGPGTSSLTAPRYHWGITNAIEGQAVPNASGTPIRIGTEE